MYQPIAWKEDHILLLDQTKLPGQEAYIECRDLETVADAIRRLAVRGAPALGVVAALAVALEARSIIGKTRDDFFRELQKLCSRILETRPTAVNMKWALHRVTEKLQSADTAQVENLKKMLEQEALAIFREDIAANQKIGMHGREIVPDKATIMTICNTGSLATAGYGTAFGVIRAAAEAGKKVLAVSCETRPLLQGSRLTAWELQKNNIPFVLITDSMAGYYMLKKGADLVIIGADRIAANGDSANKIGSYSLAILAHQHNIPFYVAAPTSTIDPDTQQGDDIPIEERKPEEITHIGNQRIAPDGVTVWNPAFDVVPFAYIAGIITEKGIIKPSFKDNIKNILGEDRQETTD
jgi:methylthioribose-1-phosphate isomerase